MKIVFTQAARRHRIGSASVRSVMATSQPSEVSADDGSQAWLWIGSDERGRELEVIALEARDRENGEHILLIIHAMPTVYRRSSR